MNRLVFGMDAGVAKWVAERLPHIKTPDRFGPCTAIGIADKDGEPIAGLVYSGFRSKSNPIDITLNIASVSPRWAQRATLHAIFSYPFDQLGVVRCTAHIAKKNKRARRFTKGVGFTEEGTLKLAFDGRDDLVIYGLTKDAWLVGPYGPLKIKHPEKREMGK